jgi:hypothetical protein
MWHALMGSWDGTAPVQGRSEPRHKFSSAAISHRSQDKFFATTALSFGCNKPTIFALTSSGQTNNPV